ncbi:MAG: hypothetical protein IKB43_02245 [Fibrobacter sp.]|nr:hypothetical protein [Fibrobacter sp.]
MKKIIALLAFALFIVGCAGTPQEQSASKMMKMQKEKQELMDKGVTAGLGVGESKSEQLAYDEADLNARTDVARAVESKVEAFIRNYQEEVGDELTQHKEEAKKNVVSDMQNGVSIIKMDMEVTEAGKFKVYAIAAMDPEAFKKAFEAALTAQKINVERARAMKGYADLDKAAAALDQYKASQRQ